MSIAERFLMDFHQARPGGTSQAFGALPVRFRGRDLASSYQVLAAAVPPSSAPTVVLDLACGSGHLLQILAQRPASDVSLFGVDFSAAELALARDVLCERATLCQAKAQHLPFAADSFDDVLSHMALMLMDEAEQVLREVHRVLKPGGVLAAVVGAGVPPTAPYACFIEALRRQTRQDDYVGLKLGDRRFNSPEGLHELLAPLFAQIVIDDIQISRRLTPDALWDWFLRMYDLYLLPEASRAAVRQEFLPAVSVHCGPDGLLECVESLRHVSAVAA
jgi:SAM-dependent methyltransferase